MHLFCKNMSTQNIVLEIELVMKQILLNFMRNQFFLSESFRANKTVRKVGFNELERNFFYGIHCSYEKQHIFNLLSYSQSNLSVKSTKLFWHFFEIILQDSVKHPFQFFLFISYLFPLKIRNKNFHLEKKSRLTILLLLLLFKNISIFMK